MAHAFELDGHVIAATDYARSSPFEDSENVKFYAIPHVAPVDSPEMAVRAAIVAEHRPFGDGSS
jgi:hypothetical protein